MGEHLQPKLHPTSVAGSYVANVHLTNCPPFLALRKRTYSQVKSIAFSVSLFCLLFLLKGLEQKLAEALHSILNDDKQGERVALYRTAVTHSSLHRVAKLVKYRHGISSFAHS